MMSRLQFALTTGPAQQKWRNTTLHTSNHSRSLAAIQDNTIFAGMLTGNHGVPAPHGVSHGTHKQRVARQDVQGPPLEARQPQRMRRVQAIRVHATKMKHHCQEEADSV